MVQENGMKCPAGSIGERLDSSRFSGQLSEHTKGIAKKDIPLFIHRVISKFNIIALV
jgi:hypothetical protein